MRKRARSILGVAAAILFVAGTAYAEGEVEAPPLVQCNPGDPVDVTSVRGEAFAIAPDGTRSPLTCGPLEACSRVVTGFNAAAALSARGVLFQLDSNTRARIGFTAEGGPAFDLEAGRARVLDARTGTPNLRITTPYATATGKYTDTDVALTLAGGLEKSVICESGGLLNVDQPGGDTVALSGGRCVVTPGEDVVGLRPRLGIDTVAGTCNPVDVAGLIDPVDVALAPPGQGPPVNPPGPPVICENQGANCGGAPPQTPPPVVPPGGGGGIFPVQNVRGDVNPFGRVN